MVPGGPASAAGIQPFRRARNGDIVPGDIVTAIAGHPVATLDELLDELEKHQPGDTIAVTVIRGGKPLEVKLRLAAGE